MKSNVPVERENEIMITIEIGKIEIKLKIEEERKMKGRLVQ
jgi:hypothetical protein